jgi:sigma-B regulation protein RsbU (phosphoserine phosphatase)
MVNCGHVQPIVVAKEAATEIEDGDLPVGLISAASFHSIQVPFPSGSRLCILTDGITETEDRQGAEFGLERVKSCILSADPVQQVFQSVESFSENREPEDDRTLVLLERL